MTDNSSPRPVYADEESKRHFLKSIEQIGGNTVLMKQKEDSYFVEGDQKSSGEKRVSRGKSLHRADRGMQGEQ